MHRILLVDDEPSILKALTRTIASPDREVETFTDPQQALRRATTTVFDLVITDYRMPGMDGVQLLRQIRALQPESMRMVISGQADMEAVVEAVNEAAIWRFIAKPWDCDELKISVANALQHRDLLMENRLLAEQLRSQGLLLERQARELARLETENPGLTRVQWQSDGSIHLDEDSL